MPTTLTIKMEAITMAISKVIKMSITTISITIRVLLLLASNLITVKVATRKFDNHVPNERALMMEQTERQASRT